MRADAYGYRQCVTSVSSFKEISRRLFGMAEEHHVNNIFTSIMLHSVNLLRSGIKGGRTKWDSNPCNRGRSKGEWTKRYSHAREANISQYQCLGLPDVQRRLLLLTHAQDVNTDVAFHPTAFSAGCRNEHISLSYISYCWHVCSFWRKSASNREIYWAFSISCVCWRNAVYRILALLPSSEVPNFFCWTLKGTSALLMYPVPIEQEVEWAPEPVWMLWRTEKSCLCWESNHNPSYSQPVVSHVILVTVTPSIITAKLQSSLHSSTAHCFEWRYLQPAPSVWKALILWKATNRPTWYDVKK
jgi:hypothetical protein